MAETINYLEINLIESETDEKVIAEVRLINKPDIDYDHAILFVNENPKGAFAEGDITKFQALDFGVAECKIVFYKNDEIVQELSQTAEFNISSWFIGVHPDLGHKLTVIEDGQSIELFSQMRARGNNDICFRMVIRVPAGDELMINHAITSMPQDNQKYNEALKVHYRLKDYKDRNNLYTPPDEAMYHIDPEVDKWIPDPVRLEHGMHVLYVVPSCKHHLSYLKIIGINFAKEAKFSVSGFFKTLF